MTMPVANVANVYNSAGEFLEARRNDEMANSPPYNPNSPRAIESRMRRKLVGVSAELKKLKDEQTEATPSRSFLLDVATLVAWLAGERFHAGDDDESESDDE